MSEPFGFDLGSPGEAKNDPKPLKNEGFQGFRFFPRGLRKKALKAPKGEPREATMPPRSAPGGARSGPRGAKEPPEAPQEHPKSRP